MFPSTQPMHPADSRPPPAAHTALSSLSPSLLQDLLRFENSGPQRERDELPARIAALEAEQATISARLADGTLFAKAPAEATALSQRHAAIDDELLAALERQEALGAS